MRSIVASITFPDSTKSLEVIKRFIGNIEDSNKVEHWDTAYYLIRSVPEYKYDSLGKKDTTYIEKGFFIKKEFVNWRIEGKEADSLQTKLKK